MSRWTSWWTDAKDTRTPEQVARYAELSLQSTHNGDDFFEWLTLAPPRPRHLALWYDLLRPLLLSPKVRFHQLAFIIRFRLLHIHSQSPYWHQMHHGGFVCPDCDAYRPCSDLTPDHACTASIFTAADVAWENLSEPIKCEFCSFPLPPPRLYPALDPAS